MNLWMKLYFTYCHLFHRLSIILINGRCTAGNEEAEQSSSLHRDTLLFMSGVN